MKFIEQIITFDIEQLCLDEAKAWNDLIESNKRFDPVESSLAVLHNLPDITWIEGKTFIDTGCGIGQLLIPVAIIKRELGHNDVLSTIFGTEPNKENVATCKMRLLDVCGTTTENIAFVEKNIVCTNSLKYDYIFNGQ